MVVIRPAWLSSSLHGCHHVRMVFIVSNVVYLLASLLLAFNYKKYKFSIFVDMVVIIYKMVCINSKSCLNVVVVLKFTFFTNLLSLMESSSSCQHCCHDVDIVYLISKIVWLLVGLSLPHYGCPFVYFI